MVYGELRFEELAGRFGVEFDRCRLFQDAPSLVSPSWLGDYLRRGLQQSVRTASAAGSYRIAPILLCCAEFLDGCCSIFSDVDLTVDEPSGLSGKCEYLLQASVPLTSQFSPTMTIVVDIDGDPGASWTKCVAQMIGMIRYSKVPVDEVFGCVTSGHDWQFMRLRGSKCTFDNDLYFLSQTDKILGILVTILKGKH